MKYFYNKAVVRAIFLSISLSLFGLVNANGQTLKGNTTYVVNGASDLVAPVDTFFNLMGSATGPQYGAISYLNANGVDFTSPTGQITILLSAGYSGIEPSVINIGLATGVGGWPNMFANASRPIVMKPAPGNNFVITTASVPANGALVRMNAAWYFTIDGEGNFGERNISFRLPTNAGTNSRVIDFMPNTGQKCQFIGVRNCQLVGNNTLTTFPAFAGVYLGSASAPGFVALSRSENLTVFNNEILGTSYGVYMRGRGIAVNNYEKNINISNNIIGAYSNPLGASFTGFTGGGTNTAGIYLNTVANATVDNNTIRNIAPASIDYRAIFLTNEGGTAGFSVDSNINITRNSIYNLNTTASGGVSGVRVSLGAYSVPRRILIANNSIANLSATAAVAGLTTYRYPIGILVDQTSSANMGLEIYYNSINLYGSTLPANGTSACVAFAATVTGGVIMMNNSFSNRMGRLAANTTGYTIYNVCYSSNTSPFTYSNFNNYFTDTRDGGLMFIARGGNNNYSSIGSFKTYSSSDSSSLTAIPPFSNDTILTVANGVNHVTFNRGAALDQFFQFYLSIYNQMSNRITNDIFGNTRSNLGRFSSIGCHLWNGDSTNANLGLVGPRTFGINGFNSYPTKLNLNGTFATLADAITYLNAYGVSGSGNINLELQPGYAGETSDLPAIIDYPNANLGTPVIIRPAANFTTTIMPPNQANFSNYALLRIEGARWLTVDGGTNRRLTFALPANATTTNARVISVSAHDAASNDVTIKNCKIWGNSTNSLVNTSVGIYLGNPVTATVPLATTLPGYDKISFIGNEIGAVRTGIYAGGLNNALNFVIQGNIIGGNIAPGGTQNTTYIGGATNQAGIFVKALKDALIDSNIIRNCLPATNISNGFRGIDIDETSGTNFSNVTVSRNQIYNLVTTTGTYCTGIRIFLTATDTINTRGFIIQNNFIGKIIGAGVASAFSNVQNPSGIVLEAAGIHPRPGINILHNTVHLSGTGMSNANSGCAALYMNANIRGGVSLVNNILINRLNMTAASGRRYAVLAAHTASPFNNQNNGLPFAINNNNYFVGGNNSNFIGGVSAITRANINDWRLTTQPVVNGSDGNSFNWPTRFLSDTTPDFEMINASLIPSGAAFVTLICDDIYGNKRFQCGSTTSLGRWIGALEFGTVNPPLQGGATYLINGTENPPVNTDPTSGSFRTVRSAINYLNSQGIDGSFGGFKTIKLAIANGYQGETDTFITPIQVLDYPRMNPSRTVVLTIASGYQDVIRVTGGIAPANLTNASIIRISGAKYFTIDGSNSGTNSRDLTIEAPSSFTAANNKVIDIISGADPITNAKPNTTNITIKNCNIIGNSTTSTINTFAGIYSGGLVTPSNAAFGRNDNLTIDNNFIGGVNYGIYLRGYSRRDSMDTYLSINGNTIGGNTAPGGSVKTDYFGGSNDAAGIYLVGQAWSNITYNIIKNSMRTASAPRGIELGTIPTLYTGLDSVCNITGNRIFNIGSNLAGGAYGVYINFGTDSSNVGRAITLANNMIYGISSLGTNSNSSANFALNPFGVYLHAPANIIRFNGNPDVGVNLYYNSINLAQSSPMTSSGAISAALGISPSIFGGVSTLNNIFQNRMGGTTTSNAFAVAAGGTVNPFKVSNYNNYYAAAPSPTVSDRVGSGIASGTRSFYNEWYDIMNFTKQDTSSIAFLAPFTSDNNLFIPGGTSSVLHGSATPILTVTGDVLGTARNFANPTIGAHEYDNGVYADSVAPRIFNVTDATSCFAFGVTLSFRIYDRLNAGDTLYYKLNGGPVTALQAAVSDGTLRTYAFPQIPGSSLLEYRVVGRDFKFPPNIGYLPMFKLWDTLNISITNFPYSNSFEGLNNPIWTVQTTNGNATWELGSFGSVSNPPLGAYTGVKAAMFRASNYSAGSSARLISPCLDFTNLKSPTLRFRVSQNSDNPTKNDSIQVSVTFGGGFFTAPLKSVRRLPDAAGTFNFPGWDVREVCLAEFAGLPGLRVGIEGFAAGGGQNILIDDIEIFEDLQTQAFTPKMYAQCFRDSIFVTVPNSDSRFNYTAYNSETGSPITLRNGNGGNLNIGILAPAVDTFRTFVYARNTFSTANGTGFNASQVSCGNIMNDTVTVVVNRYYNGPFVVAGTPFSGSYNQGDNNNPDGFKVGDTITYKFVPPAFYTNADYGTRWEVSSVTAANVTAIPSKNFTNFTVVNPTASTDGYIRAYANAAQLDTTIQFTITYRLLDSYCDSVMYRSFHVATPPTADFNVSPTGNKCALGKLFFTAEPSTRPQINFPFNFSWQFGDNTASVGLNPEKVYTTPGTYTVRLFLTDRYGLVSIKEQQITILPAPSAEFTSATPCANDSTLFSAGTQPAGTVFAWTFPGNKSDNREMARFNFPKFDTTYTVNLTVTNSSGCSHTVSKQYYVFAKPTANFNTTPHCFSNAVPITNSSTIQSGTLGFTWDWGNGQTGLGATPNYKFPSTGTFSVTMKAISNFGCVDSVVKAVTVNDRPFAGFNFSNACKDQVINLTNTTTFSGGTQNVDYSWDFGDNSFSTDATPNKVFTATGTRTVSLRTIDKLNGCRDSVRKDITINYPPVAVFTATPSPEVCVNNEVKLFNNSYTFDGDQFTCAWDFGDGNTAVACAPGGFIYTTAGNYNLKLTVTTVNGGCKDSKTQSMVVSSAPVLTVDTQYVDKQLFPYCDYSSKLKFKTNIPGAISYAWKFGDKDSSKSSQPEPTFTYNDRGVFNASVTIEDVSGCIVTKSFAVRVECKVGVQEELAAKFNLSAYPNPFNSSTNVHFETMQSENVKVSVIDMLGRVVKATDLGKLVGGAHDLNLDESFFGSAGSYLVKVEIGDVSIYKPLIKQ